MKICAEFLPHALWVPWGNIWHLPRPPWHMNLDKQPAAERQTLRPDPDSDLDPKPVILTATHPHTHTHAHT